MCRPAFRSPETILYSYASVYFPAQSPSAQSAAQFDGVEGFIFGQPPQNRKLSAQHVPSATAAITFFAADSIFSMACEM